MQRAGKLARFVLGALCAALFLETAGGLWATNDVPLHYALVARITDDWRLPNGYDPSLEELSYYPNTSHRIGAIAGRLTGSPLSGMQAIAMLSVLAIWSGFAGIYLSLPRTARWLALGGLLVVLVANRALIGLELHGHEIIANYFYPQLVAQAIAIVLLMCVLWMERRGWKREYGYLLLGGAAPIMPQFHLVPGAELIVVLGLLVLLDFLDLRAPGRRPRFRLGVLVCIIALGATAVSPAFRTMIGLSANEGLLVFKYTTKMGALAVEAGLVVVVATVMVWLWLRLPTPGARVSALAIKYLGAFGLAAGGLCLIQLLALRLGYGSEYACKKYAFAMNTLLVLDVPVLSAFLFARREIHAEDESATTVPASVALADGMYPGIVVLVLFLTVWPPLSARIVKVDEVVRAERFALQYREPLPGANAGRYDLAMDMVGATPGYDLLITIGVLRAPRTGNAEDFTYLGILSKPGRLGRIFTRAGTEPWDVPECRQVLSPEPFVILDGRCVLDELGGAPTEPR